MSKKIQNFVFTSTVLLCTLFTVFSLMFATPVDAKNSRLQKPETATGDCSGASHCTAKQQWTGGSAHGFSFEVEVSAPSYTGGDYFEKYEHVAHTGSPAVDLYMGETQNSPDFCSGTSLAYFFWDIHTMATADCFHIPTGDDNAFTTFKVSYYVSNGGGFFFWITNSTGHNYCVGSGCTYTAIPDSNSTYPLDTQTYEQVLNKASISGHVIWGTEWDDNQYFDGTNWHYAAISGSQALSCNGTDCPSPPQMYWNSAPAGSSNNGGSLWTCVYADSSNVCFLGS